jgi:predicted hydrocarbon binding protein
MKKQECQETSRVTVEALSDLEETAAKLNSMNIGRFMILPKRKVYCIAMKGQFMHNMLRKLIELADKAKVVVLSGNFSQDDSNPEVVNVLAFIDFTDSSAKPQELVAQLRRMGFLKHIQICAPTSSGFVYDSFFFPLNVGNQRAIIFRKPSYEALFSGIRKEFGSAGEAFLYYMGLETGSKLFEDYEKISGTANPRILADLACAFACNMGWGIFKLQELNIKKKIARIRIYDNFECASGKGAGKPYSHFLRGVVGGCFLYCFKTAGTVEETKCVAQGDVFCEFQVRPAKPSAKILHSHI